MPAAGNEGSEPFFYESRITSLLDTDDSGGQHFSSLHFIFYAHFDFRGKRQAKNISSDQLAAKKQ